MASSTATHFDFVARLDDHELQTLRKQVLAEKSKRQIQQDFQIMLARLEAEPRYVAVKAYAAPSPLPSGIQCVAVSLPVNYEYYGVNNYSESELQGVDCSSRAAWVDLLHADYEKLALKKLPWEQVTEDEFDCFDDPITQPGACPVFLYSRQIIPTPDLGVDLVGIDFQAVPESKGPLVYFHPDATSTNKYCTFDGRRTTYDLANLGALNVSWYLVHDDPMN